MTTITQLNLTNCRHFDAQAIEPCASLNLITGPNASGKTTVLEAIYVLAHGKSFRTSSLDSVIKKNQAIMTLFSTLSNGYDDSQEKLGLQKICGESVKLHLNQEPVRSIKQLTEQLPIQLITTESTRFFTDGPKLRRDFLAWGLFYTNETYYACWKQYQRALAQRNKSLKFKLPYQDLKVWDIQLIDAAEKLDAYYQDYLAAFGPVFRKILQGFLPDLELELRYDRGWAQEYTLEEALAKTLDKSYALGYTAVGAHRLDLQLFIDNKEVQNVLSRGQLKLASYALSLAQGLTLKELTGKKPIYLIDDLSAELDSKRQGFVFDILKSLDSQVFVTSIEPVGLKTEFKSTKSFDLNA